MRTTGTRKKSTYDWRKTGNPDQAIEGSCATCGMVWPEHWTRASKRPTPVHCTGTAIIFGNNSASRPNPHHGLVKHPPCWRCNHDSGCDNCAGRYPICDRCAVHVTVAGYARGGPIVNSRGAIWKRRGIIAATPEHYPLDFQAAYRAAEAHSPWLELTEAQHRLAVRLRDGGAEPFGELLRLVFAAGGEPSVDEIEQKRKLAQQAAALQEQRRRDEEENRRINEQEREPDEMPDGYEEF